ncbi:MAG TPA: MFS transporter [Gammaproteobacteria bacterium]|nr:MFS transporter [Gammaproteobacteria bacterium]
MQQTTARPSLFANRDFSLLFGGSSISALGDQFTLVALPWLVLKLTGNPAALGLVLAVMALPRALFILIGGALVDRMSPRRVLLGSRAVNAALITVLAVLVWSGAIQMWMVYVLACGIGLATAFMYPASTAILPQLVSFEQLRAANATFMGMRQLCMFVGPGLAGLVISLGAHRAGASGLVDATGMGFAFSVDAVSFLFSLGSLMLVRVAGDHRPPSKEGGVLTDVVKGMRNIWADRSLRAFILYAGVVSVFVAGPIQVGLPVLADTRLDLGAAALGVLMTANGGGIVIGSVLSGLAIRLARGRVGIMVLCMDCGAGLVILALTLVHATLAGAVLLGLAGLLAGIAQVAIFTWVQQRVPQAMMGRTMSVLLFTFMGLAPISAAVAGALLKVVSLGALFAGAGVLLSVIALLCLANPHLRAIGHARQDAATVAS